MKERHTVAEELTVGYASLPVEQEGCEQDRHGNDVENREHDFNVVRSSTLKLTCLQKALSDRYR